MIRACIFTIIMGFSSPVIATADDYDPHQMPGTYQYCQSQLDRTLRQIDWQSAAALVDERVQQARQRYERCLRDRPLESASASSVR